MKKYESYARVLPWFMALALSVLLAACGGGRDGILGSGGISPLVAPTVTAVVPLNRATGVPINTKIIAVAFNRAMDPATLTSTSFLLACPLQTPIAGTVSYLAAGNVARLLLPAASNLPTSALCTATVTTQAKDATGIALANSYVWTFTTSATADIARPRVTLTAPATTTPGPTAGAPTNTAITAVFNEDMDPASITAAGTFVLTGPGVTTVVGTAIPVTYAVGSRTATFHPAAALAANTTYTATISTVATDLANNALAGDPALPLAANNYVWTFSTAAAAAQSGPVTILSTSIKPAADAAGVCPSTTIQATFSVPSGMRMDPVAVSTAFTVAGPALTPVAATSVKLDNLTGMIATFAPSQPLTNGVTYTATIKGGSNGVKDLAVPSANTMANDYSWSFVAGPATGICLPPVNLGAIATFGIAATAGVTNTTTAPLTTINGDVVLDPVSGAICNNVPVDAAGGFGLCGSNGSTPIINGTVISPYYPDGGATSGAVKAALLAAYLSITPLAGPPAAGSLGAATNLPAGTTLGALTGSALVQGDNLFTPGVYQSVTSILITDDLTLDAQGNPDAIFVFQSSSTVGTADGSVGTHPRILLINGAKASNVYWQAGTSATLGTSTEWKGNILAGASITMKTGASSCGRLLAGAFTAGAFVFDSNVVSVPGNVNAPASCQ